MRNLDPVASAADAYVERGRAALRNKLPGADFDAAAWDAKPLWRDVSDKVAWLYFTLEGSTVTPLPHGFARVIKAYVALQSESLSRRKQKADAARWLWAAVSERLGQDAGARFVWADLQSIDVRRATQIMEERGLGSKGRYNVDTALRTILRELAGTGVCPSLPLGPRLPRGRDGNLVRVDEEVDLVPPTLLAALGDIFAKYATSWEDRLMSAVIALALATGLRFNELSTIPLDPIEEVERDLRGPDGKIKRHKLWRVRRYKSKSSRTGGGGRKSEEAQWMTATQAELAREAVRRIRDLTAASRRVVAALVRAGRWALPAPYTPSSWLEASEIANVLGVSRDMATKILREEGGEADPDAPRAGMLRMSGASLEAYMNARLKPNDLVLMIGANGRPIPLSEGLLCLRVNETHSAKATLSLPQKLTASMLQNWLVGSTDKPNVFQRMAKAGVRFAGVDPEKKVLSSHDFRRWFATSALRAGATEFDLMRWQGREHMGDLGAYDYRTMADRVEAVKRDIKSGKLQGVLATTYVQLAETIRDQWLDDAVTSLHVTPIGLCAKDFGSGRCEYQVNCFNACEHHLVQLTDPKTRQQVVQLKCRNEEVVRLNEERALREGYELASQWRQEYDQTITYMDHLLTAKPDEAGYVRAPEGAPSRYLPVDQVGPMELHMEV